VLDKSANLKLQTDAHKYSRFAFSASPDRSREPNEKSLLHWRKMRQRNYSLREQFWAGLFKRPEARKSFGTLPFGDRRLISSR
jgi:hypothetical protein